MSSYLSSPINSPLYFTHIIQALISHFPFFSSPTLILNKSFSSLSSYHPSFIHSHHPSISPYLTFTFLFYFNQALQILSSFLLIPLHSPLTSSKHASPFSFPFLSCIYLAWVLLFPLLSTPLYTSLTSSKHASLFFHFFALLYLYSESPCLSSALNSLLFLTQIIQACFPHFPFFFFPTLI